MTSTTPPAADPPRARTQSMTDFLRARANGHPIDILDLLQSVDDTERRALEEFSDKLPKLTERDLKTLDHTDSSCPICLVPFLHLLAEEETALALDSPAHPVEELGVTRLVDTCKHLFCRRDIRNWMRQGRGTCPTCRTPFLPPSNTNPSSANPRSPLGVGIPPGMPHPLDGLISIPEDFGPIALQIMDAFADSGITMGSGRGRQDSEEDDREGYSGMYS